MATFANTTSPTSFGFFDNETAFQIEADAMVTFVKRHLGDSVLSVELTKKQIWDAFEFSTLEFSRLINQYEAKSNLSSLLGSATGSLSGSTGKYLRQNLEFLTRQAEPYAWEAGIGGSYTSISGSITLEPLRQDYDLYEDLRNEDGARLSELMPSGTRGKLKIREVFHVSPHAAYRYYGSTSGISFLQNNFSFESFTPETIFYVLPVFEDILRAGQMDISQRVRRSNYSYKITGKSIRIHPIPTEVDRVARKLFIRVDLPPDPTSPEYEDDSVNGVSNISNAPYGNLEYTNINSIGRQWIRKHTLAVCKEMLGYVRGKFKEVPIPSGQTTLNGDELMTHGREDRDNLVTQMIELMETLTHKALAVEDVEKGEALLRQLRLIPMPNGMAIFTG